MRNAQEDMKLIEKTEKMVAIWERHMQKNGFVDLAGKKNNESELAAALRYWIEDNERLRSALNEADVRFFGIGLEANIQKQEGIQKKAVEAQFKINAALKGE